MTVAPADTPRSITAIVQLFDLSHDMLGTISIAGYFTLLNPAWDLTLGWTRDELMARPYLSFVHPDDYRRTADAAAEIATPGALPLVDFENRYRTRDGDYRSISWTVVPEHGEMFFVAKDVTAQKVAEAHMDQAGSLRRAILDSVADGVYVSDSHGLISFVNPAGLSLLRYESADELIGLGPHAAFHHSRLDGTPFAVEDCELPQVRKDGVTRHSFDNTFWRRDGTPLPVSYSSAAIKLDEGLGSVVAFRDISAMQAERERVRLQFGDIAWFEEIRNALAKGRFVLYRQPIIELSSGRTIKHELLLRMLTLTGEVIPPGLFLPSAEKYGLIQDIDRWVFTQAVELAAAGESVSVNLSAESIGDAEMLRHIEAELDRTGADPSCLTFEVTETAVMRDLQDGREFANHLVARGCSFALDDFGTGYGSLTYLRELPIDYLKIDIQFVRNMTSSEADRKLVATIVSIAKNLEKMTVAEGIEDEATLMMLASLEVDFGQGYFLGHPEPIVALSAHATQASGGVAES
jgi:PAS domain S-box-containing protein